MDRRNFIKYTGAVAGTFCFSNFASLEDAFSKGKSSPQVGKALKPWEKGQLQLHFIYTGVGETIFCIFPDGTSMLIDCPGQDAIGRGAKAVPLLPNSKRHAGEWIARYVERVNPGGKDVDYMLLTHYHNDHAGCSGYYSAKEIRDGEEYWFSGFAEAARTLHFHKAIDRNWPDMNYPAPLDDDYDTGTVRLVKSFYKYHSKHGLLIEQFRLGATDQIVPLKKPSECGGFSIRNICGNGRICGEDGVIRDLYADRIAAGVSRNFSENGMSLGMIMSYGNFKFFTAGDFSDSWKLEDGTVFHIEDALADVCPRVNVAKINHHAHHSMTPKLIKALSPRVFVNSVWDQSQNLPDVMSMCADRSIYPGDRIICPNMMTPRQRAAGEEAGWMKDIDTDSFEGGHIVITVEKGGCEYSVTYLTADDESMTVRSVMNFNSDE